VSDLTDDEKSSVYQYMYRHSGLTHDQVWALIDDYGYRKAYSKIRKAYNLEESFEDVYTDG